MPPLTRLPRRRQARRNRPSRKQLGASKSCRFRRWWLRRPSSRASTCRRFSIWARRRESAAGALDLPAAAGREFAVGEMARSQSAEGGLPVPWWPRSRGWPTAESTGASRILPWNAPDDIPRISPVEATRRYLEHLIGAWSEAFPGSPLRRAAGGLDRPGLLRCQRPRVDARGGAGRRLRRRLHPPRGAASGGLCVAR